MELVLLVGIAVIASFLYLCFKAVGHVCPGCGEKLYFSRADRKRMRFGRLPCPKCGMLIEVDH